MAVVCKSDLPNEISYKFSKHVRLLSSHEYQAVFSHVDIKAPSKHLLLLARFNGKSHSRLGLVIGKKHVKRAVDRNRCKRVLRECFRNEKDCLPALDIIAIARFGVAELNKSEISHLTRSLLKKLAKRAQKDQKNRPFCKDKN